MISGHSKIGGQSKKVVKVLGPAKDGPPAIEGPVVIEKLMAIARLAVHNYKTEMLLRKGVAMDRLLW
jgi:hypothetical protein